MAKNYQRRNSADSRANAHQPTSKQLKSSAFQDNRRETALQRELKELAEYKSIAPVTQQTAQLQIEGTTDITPPDIFDLINHYNLLEKELTLSQRINSISLIEHVIYQWLIENKHRDPTEDETMQHVRFLMDATKTERNRIVTDSIDNGDHDIEGNGPPIAGFDLLDNKTQKEVRQMWLDLVEGSGNIKITNVGKLLVEKINKINSNDNSSNNPEEWEFKDVMHQGFTLKILTEFSRLLEGEYGRNLVKRVNESKRIIEIEPYKKETRNKSLGAAPKQGGGGIEDKLIKLEKAPEDSSEEKYPVHTIKNEIERVNFFNELKPLKINQAGVKVIDGDTTTYYQFGSGFDVTIEIPSNLDDSSFENDSRLADEFGEELATPLFILLGHEIGHGIHIQQGTASPYIQIPNLFPNKNVGDIYSGNNEEYVNIKGTENSLRNEHKLGKREGHGSYLNYLAYKVSNNIKLLIENYENYKNIQPTGIIKDIIDYLDDLRFRFLTGCINPELLPLLKKEVLALDDKIKQMEKNLAISFIKKYTLLELENLRMEINNIDSSIISENNKIKIINLFIRKINIDIEKITNKKRNHLKYLNNISQSRELFIDKCSEAINEIMIINGNEISESDRVKKIIVKFIKAEFLFKK